MTTATKTQYSFQWIALLGLLTALGPLSIDMYMPALPEMAVEFGIRISEPDMTRYDIFTADECFLTGTAAEVIPVVAIDSRLIGDGVPGPITRRLMERFHQLTETTGTAIY